MPKYMPPKEDPGSIVVPAAAKRGMSLQCPLLTRNNYASWALRMRVILQAHSVWDAVIKDDIDEHTDRQAIAVIYQGILEDVLLMLAENDSAKKTWEALKVIHMAAERRNFRP